MKKFNAAVNGTMCEVNKTSLYKAGGVVEIKTVRDFGKFEVYKAILRKDAKAFWAEAPDYVKGGGLYKQFAVTILRPRILADPNDPTKSYWFVQAGTEQVPVNRETPYLESLIVDKVVTTGIGDHQIPVREKRYSEAFIYVEADKDYLDLYEDPIFKFDFEGKEVFCRYLPQNGKFQNIMSGTVFGADLVIDENGDLRDGVIVYDASRAEDCTVTTPGNLKKKLMKIYACNLAGLDLHKLSNSLKYGMFEELEAQLRVSKAEGAARNKEVAQAAARCSQAYAAAVELGCINGFAIYMGKFKSQDGEEYMDGHSFVDSHFLTEAINAKVENEFIVHEEAIRGLGVQARPYSCKVFAQSVRQEFMRHFARNLEVVYIYRDQITEETQSEFSKTVFSKGKAGKYAGKLVVVVDTAANEGIRWDFLTDLNGLKAPFNLRAKSALNSLTVSHPIHSVRGNLNTSTQLMQSLYYADFDMTERLVESFTKREAARFKKEAANMESRTVSAADITNMGNYVQNVGSINPEFASVYAPIRNKRIDQWASATVKAVNEVHFKANGIVGQMIPDLAKFFGINLLQHHEVFCSGAEEHRLVNGVAVKYPKMHMREYSLVNFVSKKEYIRRAGMVMKEADYRLFVDMVSHIHEGWVVTPAYSDFLDKHAGADYDGDKIAIYVSEEITDILGKGEDLTVHIR